MRCNLRVLSAEEGSREEGRCGWNTAKCSSLRFRLPHICVDFNTHANFTTLSSKAAGNTRREGDRKSEWEREICRCDCKSVAFLHLTSVAPLPSPSPPPPAPHGLNKYWLCHFSQKCVKPFACVWRTTTKADSVARAVEMPLLPFILCCLRNTHWWNCITKELGNCQKKTPIYAQNIWKEHEKGKIFQWLRQQQQQKWQQTVAAAGATRSVPLPRVGQPAGKVSWPMQLFILIKRVFCCRSHSHSLSPSLSLLWLFRFAAKVN